MPNTKTCQKPYKFNLEVKVQVRDHECTQVLSYSKKREIFKGVRVNIGLIIIFIGSIMQLITTRKVAQNHMIIKLINIAYVTKFLHIKKNIMLRSGPNLMVLEKRLPTITWRLIPYTDLDRL